MNEEIYNKCFMVESDKQDRNEDSFRAIRLDDLFKITDKYNSADNLEKENTKLKQDKGDLITWLEEEIDKLENEKKEIKLSKGLDYSFALDDSINIYKKFLSKLNEGDKQ